MGFLVQSTSSASNRVEYGTNRSGWDYSCSPSALTSGQCFLSSGGGGSACFRRYYLRQLEEAEGEGTTPRNASRVGSFDAKMSR